MQHPEILWSRGESGIIRKIKKTDVGAVKCKLEYLREGGTMKGLESVRMRRMDRNKWRPSMVR